ncbi:MAG: hypothetical protein REI11_00650 [Patulibacter sp.]|nr:hypothetical protein [Patulibacter sp.]
MSRSPVAELRVTWGFAQVTRSARPGLVADVDLLEEQVLRDAEGKEVRAVHAAPLCVGKVLWPGGRWDDLGLASQTIAWLRDDPGADLAALPRGLYQGGATDVLRWWGTFVGMALQNAVGGDRIAELVDAAESGAKHVRFVFRARDDQAARIPVETLFWPLADSLDSVLARGVSILRTPGSVSTADPWSVADFAPAEVDGLQAMVVRTSGRPLTDDAASTLGLDGAHREVTDHASWSALQADPSALRFTDLLMVTGTGTPDRGLDADDTPDEPLDGYTIGTLVTDHQRARNPSAVVLASCGSAESPAPGGDAWLTASLAATVSELGAPLVIGFQGETVGVPAAMGFTASLTRAWRTRLAEGDGSPTLRDWEDAVAVARAANQRAAAVVFAHPATLLGRDTRGTTTVHAAALRTGSRIVAPYYVFGQLAWTTPPDEPERLLRVPVPVDCGVRLVVTVGDGALAAPDVRTTNRPLSDNDRHALFAAWPELAALGFSVTLADGSARLPTVGNPFRQPIRPVAHLAATVRAIADIVGVPVPGPVLDLVHRRVAEAGGTPDGRVRLIDHATGSTYPGLRGEWPALRVEPTSVTTLVREPDLADDTGFTVPFEIVVAGLDTGALLARAAEQQRRLSTTSLLLGSHEPLIFWPVAARVGAATGPDGVPRTADVDGSVPEQQVSSRLSDAR